jgi:hypothetical protein
MQHIGGVTAWYCSRCGAPVRTGGVCQCGGGGVPQGPIVYNDPPAFVAWIERTVRRFTRRPSHTGEGDSAA